jgi:hypothetical protein
MTLEEQCSPTGIGVQQPYNGDRKGRATTEVPSTKKSHAKKNNMSDA